MISRFFRSFFWAVLVAFVLTYIYLGFVSSSTREAVLVEDRFDGLQAEAIGPGEWSFVSGRIMPGRVTLHRVQVRPRFANLKYQRGLSQSEILGLDKSYYIQAGLRFEYELQPERLRALFLQLDQPGWHRLDAYLQFRVRSVLDRYIKSIYQNDGDIPELADQLYAYFGEGQAVAEMNRDFASVGIVVQSITPVRIYVPDQARYQAMLNLGERVLLDLKLERIRQINQARTARDTRRIADGAYFARLEKIGKLLQRYPYLREYVAIDRLGDQVQVMVVPEERFLGSKSGAGQNAYRDPVQSEIEKRLPGRIAQSRPDPDALPDAGDAAENPLPATRGARRAGQFEFRDLTPP